MASTPDNAPGNEQRILSELLSKIPGSPEQRPLETEHIKDLVAARGLRIAYAIGWFAVAVGLLVFTCWLMLKIGKKELAYDEWVLRIYMGGVFATVYGIVRLIM